MSAATTLPPTPKSPSVGARRKGPKDLPRLPLSAFTPPNTGTSDKFPLAPSPSTLQPTEIVDAHVIAPRGDLDSWKSQLRNGLSSRITGLVLSLHGANLEELDKVVRDVQSFASSSSSSPILAIAVPYVLEDGAPASPPSYLSSASSSKPSIVLSTTFKRSSPKAIDALKWALQEGFTVIIDVQSDLQTESGWDSLEELLTRATAKPEAQEGSETAPVESNGKIVLSAYPSPLNGTSAVLSGDGIHKGATVVLARSVLTETLRCSDDSAIPNILPPPDNLAVPIVKLLTHQLYQTYQAHIGSLSLFANIFINFVPPAWDAPTPVNTNAPPAEDGAQPTESAEKAKEKAQKEAREWKRRIKMYVGPTVEAFGFQRILFGSSPAAPLTASTPASSAADWFELARASFAELGVEQDAIDAVFAENAKAVYGASSRGGSSDAAAA
ncbi:hypothetical protein BN946_scf184856.g3 [Trametes cinnabarina]|uniref:Uncharacterized protein n=1 Tax=Pycnoporus cinnabarinus TaxID=5643 RepID=A0A060SDM4_PYCCI|nr:hypothetical protein BN946_scf184856.g3 [Trametes cinnabarina]